MKASRRGLAVLALGLLGLPFFPQIQRIETRAAPLLGPPATARPEASPSLRRLEAYDAQGRLLLLALASEPEAAAENPAGAGSVSAGGRTTAKVPASKASVAPPAPTPAMPAPKAAASAGKAASKASVAPAREAELAVAEFRYDARGRLVEIQRRSGLTAPPDSVLTRSYDELGRLRGVEFSQGEGERFFLELRYEGSGRGGTAVLRDAKGQILEAATLVLGGGAAGGFSAALALVGPEGADGGSLELAYDAGGRLSAFERRLPERSPDAETAAAPPKGLGAQGATPAESGAKGAAAPDILSLLGPWLPDEGPPPPYFALLPENPTAPSNPRNLFESGFQAFPFRLPEEGRAEFLYDAAGRPLLARRFSSEAVLEFETNYRYDERGFLVEEELWRAASAEASTGEAAGTTLPGVLHSGAADSGAADSGAADSGAVPGEEGLLLVHRYRLGPAGRWLERFTFLREERRGLEFLSPREYRKRTAP